MGILGRLLAGSRKSGPEARAAADERIARGQALEDAGDFAGAELRFREALERAPDYPRAHINLGNALHKQGRLEDAAEAHGTAAELDPAYAGAHFNLGTVLLQLGRIHDAKVHFVRVLALDPAMVDAAVMLASASEAEGDLAGARAHLEHALRIQPRHGGAAANLGTVLTDLGDIPAATRAFRDALAIEPRNALALAGLARLEVRAGRAQAADELFRSALAVDGRDPLVWSSFLFSLNLRDDLDAAAVAREHRAFGRAFEASAPAAATARPARGKRIRVGYVSGDLMKHPVALFLRPVLEGHDREAFDIFCYSNGVAEDEVTRELRAHAGEWRVIHGREDPWVESRVREDAIDILVDLSGHTAHNRLGVFARKPAPVQATWLGYLNTTGLASMDYRICDRFTDPEGETEALNTEKLARLPASQWCYAPYYDIALPQRAALSATAVTFGSFNQFAKIGDACLDLWAEVLRRVPGSKLRVHGVPQGLDPGDFLGRLERRGVERARVALAGRLGIREYFTALGAVDIALDSMPYNGATTTLDTLWMGTPLVALRGTRAIGRGSFSIASGAGLDELVVGTPEEYVEANVRLANDVAARMALHASLRARLESSPLMDAPRFVRGLEDAYRAMLGS